MKPPAWHSVHPVAARSRSVNSPAAHVRQDVAPLVAEYVSGGHAKQVVALVPLENRPARQSRHPLEYTSFENRPGWQARHLLALCEVV